jgi:hypothetical protein
MFLLTVKPTSWIQDLAAAVGAQKISWDAGMLEAYVLVLPEGSIKLTPVVPAMGEHWAKPQDMPIGPKGSSHTNLGGKRCSLTFRRSVGHRISATRARRIRNPALRYSCLFHYG